MSVKSKIREQINKKKNKSIIIAKLFPSYY